MDPILALLLSGLDISSLFTFLSAQRQQQQRQQQGPAQRYPFNPPQLTAPPAEGGAGFGDGAPGSTKGTEESGKLSGQLGGVMSGLGSFRSGVGAVNSALGLFGQSVPALGMFGLATTPIGMVNTASALFGGLPSVDPAYGLANVQDIADYAGYMAAAEAAQRNAQSIADWNATVARDLSGYADYSSGAPSPGGWGGSPSAPSASVGPEAGWGPAGPDSSNSPGTAGMGPDSASGGPGSTDGPDRALGGVDYARRPTTRRFGERSTGGEMAIFIPSWMRQPGIQGREAEVRNALLRAIMGLR